MKFLTQFIKTIINRNTFAIAMIFIIIAGTITIAPTIYGIFFLRKKKRNIVRNQDDIDDIKIIDSNENNENEDDERIIIDNLKKNSNLTDFNIRKINLKKNDFIKNTKLIKNNTGIIPIKKINIDTDVNNDNKDNDANFKIKIKSTQEKLIDKYTEKIKHNNGVNININGNNIADVIDQTNGEKIYSGSWIGGSPNGNGCLYSTKNNGILYKGYFINGNLNGQGNIYNDNGIIIYSGYFMNNKKNGKGVEFYDDGKLKFDGTFVNGEKNGPGKEFYQSGRVKTIATWKNNKIDDTLKIIEHYDNEGNKIKFEGFKNFYTKDGKEEKKCRVFNEEGTMIYEGTMNKGMKWNGRMYDNGAVIKVIKNGETFNVNNSLHM